jgi:hypothetical protein
MFQRHKSPAPACICSGAPEMKLLVDGKTFSIHECEACARLLMQSKAATFQRWYVPEEGGTFCLTMAKEMYCQKCQSDQIHVKSVRGAWLCLSCRVRDGEASLKKEGEKP